MNRLLGVNTWVWTSPLTDAVAAELLPHVAGLGFDAVELPLESAGDLTADGLGPLLEQTGLTPYVVGAMAPGRDLVIEDSGQVSATQAYLRDCVALAAGIGATSVCGPFYAATGRCWPMSAEEREATYARWRRALAPVAEYAAARGVTLGIEPLNRYETSLVNTVEQALTGLGDLLGSGVGLALDTYHLNLEERSSAAAIRAAGEHLIHLQVCGNDRGAPGEDQTDWPGIMAALDEVGYIGALNIESFTAHNASIARAASIWRPLAASQDALASDGLTFLRALTGAEAGTRG